MLKKILIMLLLGLSLISCERKPLYLQGDVALKINVQVEANIDALWNIGWRDTLKYDWDETKYGSLFYTSPSTCNVVIFNKGQLLSETKIQTNKRQLIDVELNNIYDLLIYSKEYFWTETYYEGGIYYVENPSTEVPPTKNEISKEYETVEQPGEVFAMNKKEIYLSDDLSDYEEIVEDDGRIVYVYNIDEMLEPVSYIYVVQFIVINDDHSLMIEARDIMNFTISGISTKKNMFTNTPLWTGNKQISTFDIKPGQMHGPDSLVFASRVTILDLLPDNIDSSWSSRIDYLYYTNIDVDTYNYGEVTGTKDITKQLMDNPKGGVITIIILNSELKPSSPTDDNGFGVSLDEWKQYMFDVF